MVVRGSQRARFALAIVSVLCLIALAWVGPTWEASRWPGVVVAGSTFRVSALSPGRYAWTLEEGRAARGPGLIRQHLYQVERDDLVELALANGLSTGMRVAEGQTLGSLRSSRLYGERERLLAERAALNATLDQLIAGARPEELAQARAQVAVATAKKNGLDPLAGRERALSASGASAAEVIEQAESAAEVAAREVDLARAALVLLAAPARQEEVSALQSQLAAIDADLSTLQRVSAEENLTSPINGVLELGGTLERDGEPVVLRVLDLDTVFVRIEIPPDARRRVHAGDKVRFVSPAAPGARFEGSLVEISEAAAIDTADIATFWGVAKFSNTEGQLRPGYSGIAEIDTTGGAAAAGDAR